MNVKEAILTRRSVRKYKKEPVKEEDLKVILEAARQAPSAGNKQPWEFVVVKDQETKTKLAEIARNQKLDVIYEPELLGGINIIKGALTSNKIFTAIPYYTWNNRGPTKMQVWNNFESI